MTLFVSIIGIALFIAYFYAIGLWYLGLIPLVLFVAVLVYNIGDISLKDKTSSLIGSYGLFIAREIILIGLYLAAKFFGVTAINSFLFLIIINILFLFGSYLFKYHDGKIIAHSGLIISIVACLIYLWIIIGPQSTFQAFEYFRAFYTAIIGFIVFIMGAKYEINYNYKYLLALLIGGCILIFLYKILGNIYTFLVVLVILLQIIYYFIYFVKTHKPPTVDEQKEISVRRILAGERILKGNTEKIVKKQIIYDYIEGIPQFIKYSLEGINAVLIIVLFCLYFKKAISLHGFLEQIFYWVILIGFLANAYSLKRINYTSIVQRLLTFFVLNFAIYISLFSIFSGDLGTITFLCIIWNILSASAIFSIHKTKIGKYLKKIDYIFWVFSTILALIVNILLLFNIGIGNAFLFPTILLYVGIQGFMIYYSIKFIYNIQEPGGKVDSEKSKDSEENLTI